MLTVMALITGDHFRLHSLCELFPEIQAGEKVRAVAEWTGLSDILLPESASLDLPETRLVFRKIII